jgi:hypothetical protein
MKGVNARESEDRIGGPRAPDSTAADEGDGAIKWHHAPNKYLILMKNPSFSVDFRQNSPRIVGDNSYVRGI